MTKHLHNSPLFLHLDSSMQAMASQMLGQRNSNYLYRLDSEANGYECNIFFSPQPQVMLSRILAAEPTNLKNSKIDLTFATDLAAKDFDNISFNGCNAQMTSYIENMLLSLTKSINFNGNWKQTIDVNKLVNILGQSVKHDKLLRHIDTIRQASGDLNQIVKAVVSSLGMDKAQNLIPKTYKPTNLAALWFDSFKALKMELDSRGLTDENMKNMNFTNKQDEFKRFTK